MQILQLLSGGRICDIELDNYLNVINRLNVAEFTTSNLTKVIVQTNSGTRNAQLN